VGVEREIQVPDIGDFSEVDVIEVLVAPGDRVEVEDSLITLESDKATLEVPSPVAGVVKELLVRVGDKVSEGRTIARIEVEGESESREKPAKPAAAATREPPPAPAAQRKQPAQKPEPPQRPEPTRGPAPARAPEPAPRGERTAALSAEHAAAQSAAELPRSFALAPEDLEEAEPRGARAHASPSVRRLARELGVDLRLVPPSGPHGRIVKEDLQSYVKGALAKGSAAGVPLAGVAVARPPEIDFSKFGPTELQPLNRVRKLSAANLHRSWVTVPHVTQFDAADVTELERFRKEHRAEAEAAGTKLTFLPFVVKAVCRALREMPHFNSSLDRTGENLIVKRYLHIGVAVETEHGLVVPVIRDADAKGIFELARQVQDLSERARSRKLAPGDMQGASFSISSLGGIGGTAFTPIVNHPEVAILGVSRMEWRPVWQDGQFVPRLVLPLSLSYDHRVIDGADAARFTTRLAALLADLRLLVL
jgi:pyruvate dehydrogenase E2 component (dihydrolipoamide acetyltransferase)